MSKSSFPVQILEREDDQEDYKLPQILCESDKEEEEQDQENESESEASEASEDEEEDEEAALLTPALDTQILRTIAAIQNKDPRVYDPASKFFEEEHINKANEDWEIQQKKLKTATKKVTLKDYERETLLTAGGYYEEDERIDDEDAPKYLTHNEEQNKIKQDFKLAALDDSEDEEEREDKGGFLLKKEKTEEEREAEEAEYKNFLLKNIAKDEASSEVFKEWHTYKNNPTMNKDDAFLIDYVLNRGWVDKKKENKPYYEHLTEIDKDIDEEYLDQVDRFESKFNFRFEEEGGLSIIGHSRNVENSVRRKETKRQKERERRKAKKAADKLAKVNELKQVKHKKMKEIQERLSEIRKITGNDDLDLKAIDMEADFDPDTWDAQMDKVFNDEYYNGEDNEKPVWDDDIEGYEQQEDTDLMMDADFLPGGSSFTENSKKRKKEVQEDDVDLMMDADFLPGGESYGRQSKKHKTEEQHVSSKQKAAQEEYKKLMAEYESLGFEDMVGDLPTRFKYVQTEAEDFGLTAEEILLADDTELNRYMGLKTLAPYRTEEARTKDARRFKRYQKAKMRDLEKHLEKSISKPHSKHKTKTKTNITE
ncbi:KRI1-like family C-terminal-domain-containing protein [Spinellus fusiger]|nr:KRI1-like family C-terminal-domain-containing protein [Spinellus fusiger]